MANNKHIDDFIEGKLRKSRVVNTSGDFSSMLMQKIQAEGKLALEETKTDRLAKHFIGGFSSLVIGLTILIAYLSGSRGINTSETSGINISPALHSSNNLFGRFADFIESVFVQALELVGLSASSKTISIILTVIGIVCLFLLAERFLIRGKFRSSVNMK